MTSCKINDKNQLKKQFISSQAFHRTPGVRAQEITVGDRFEPRILESFDPVTQEHNRASPARTETTPQQLELELS
jgi:hypothetical protein